MSELRTLTEIRIAHRGHCGFIWMCKHCGTEYKAVLHYEELAMEAKMHTGMLWFDNSQIALTQKIQKGLDYYKKKYGRDADLVLIHPSMFPEQEKQRAPIKIGSVTVRPYRPVLPGHIWIGIEDKE